MILSLPSLSNVIAIRNRQREGNLCHDGSSHSITLRRVIDDLTVGTWRGFSFKKQWYWNNPTSHIPLSIDHIDTVDLARYCTTLLRLAGPIHCVHHDWPVATHHRRLYDPDNRILIVKPPLSPGDNEGRLEEGGGYDEKDKENEEEEEGGRGEREEERTDRFEMRIDSDTPALDRSRRGDDLRQQKQPAGIGWKGLINAVGSAWESGVRRLTESGNPATFPDGFKPRLGPGGLVRMRAF